VLFASFFDAKLLVAFFVTSPGTTSRYVEQDGRRPCPLRRRRLLLAGSPERSIDKQAKDERMILARCPGTPVGISHRSCIRCFVLSCSLCRRCAVCVETPTETRRRIGRERERRICQRTDRDKRSSSLTRRRSVRFFSAFSASSFESELLFALTAPPPIGVRRAAPDFECSTRAVTTRLPRFGPRLLRHR
jgi:hypothetical protein